MDASYLHRSVSGKYNMMLQNTSHKQEKMSTESSDSDWFGKAFEGFNVLQSVVKTKQLLLFFSPTSCYPSQAVV